MTAVAVGLVAIAAFKLAKKVIDGRRLDSFLACFSCCALICFHWLFYVPPLLMTFGGVVAFANWFLVKRLVTARHTRLIDDDDGQVESGAGYLLSPSKSSSETETATQTHGDYIEHYKTLPSMRTGAIMIAIWLVVLLLSFAAQSAAPNTTAGNMIRVFCTFYITGSIIFGGGPVVVPLLYSYVVEPGWMSAAEFALGFALINIAPGPNFNFAAYCSGISLLRLLALDPAIHSHALIVGCVVLGSFLGYFAIFWPGLMLKVSLLPYWSAMRQKEWVQAILSGLASSAVGLVFASIYLTWKTVPAPELNNIYIVVAISTFVSVEYLRMAPLLTVVLACAAVLVQAQFIH